MSKGRRGYKQHRNKYRPGSQPTYWQTEAYNQQLFNMFRNDLIELALSRFRWLNLPETCNERFLEWTLLTEGAATLAFPNTGNTVLSLRAVQQGAPNMYNEPRAWRALGITGKTDFMCNWGNAVWIWENRTRYPLLVKINIWARELADITGGSEACIRRMCERGDLPAYKQGKRWYINRVRMMGAAL